MKCVECGKEFEPKNYASLRKYCSRDCKRAKERKNYLIRKPLLLSDNRLFLSKRFKVLERDKFTCKYCGRSPTKDIAVTLMVDHIIPVSKGGSSEIDNLITSCSECNLGKSDCLLSERSNTLLNLTINEDL